MKMLSVKTILVFIIITLLIGSQICVADELQDIAGNINSSPDLIAKGKNIYMSNCMSCHGNEGKGDGPAAGAFNPKPRNFTTEAFKQGSSPSQTYLTVTNGLGSMPSFSSMPIPDRLAVIHYILSLSANKSNDTPESLAKIGLGPDKKPLAGFKTEKLPELPVDFIIERMSTNGNINKLNFKDLAKAQEEQQKASIAVVAPSIIKPDIKHGEVLFNNCITCHGKQGEGDSLSQAPQIAGQDTAYIIAQIKKFQTGIRGAHPNDVNGLKMRPMSRILQSDQDVTDVAHFIKTLTPVKPIKTFTEGNPQKGQASYATCLSCHGPDAKGITAMSAPSLRHLQDWYILNQVNSFKQGHRGADARDTTGSQMRAMSMMLPDDQAVKDIVAYIESLK